MSIGVSDVTVVLEAVLSRLPVRSVVDHSAGDGLRHTLAADVAYQRASSTGVAADLAVVVPVPDEGFEDALGRVLRSAERFALVGQAADAAPYRITDAVEVRHRDFALVERFDGPDGELFLFERRTSERHTLPGRLVVSLTSYAARFPTLELTVRSLLQQTVRPDDVVLWLAPGDVDQLPTGVVDLQREGLTIRVCADLRSYKKLVPALLAYPDAYVVVVDDDLIHPVDMLEPLVRESRSKREILCRRGHVVRYDADGRPLPYQRWAQEVLPGAAHSDVFPTTGHGTLYPPGSLDPRATDVELFTRLAPDADDVWFHWMARLAGSTSRVVGQTWQNMTWPGSQETSLMSVNVAHGGNDRQVAAMVEHFGVPAAAPVPAEAAVPGQETFDSADYWSRRYAKGGNSGAGSYGRLAEFKAEFVNAYVDRHGIGTVIEFGSGDGAQLELATYPTYVGFDVAQVCLEACRSRFASDPTKSFLHTDDYAGHTADLTLSLDVIYHLIEDEVFHAYMTRLFEASSRHVIVYASNEDRPGTAVHVRHRRFTDWVEQHRPDFALTEHVPNRFPLVGDDRIESFADFYVFERA
jgi:protein O-GlcNAc transferase